MPLVALLQCYTAGSKLSRLSYLQLSQLLMVLRVVIIVMVFMGQSDAQFTDDYWKIKWGSENIINRTEIEALRVETHGVKRCVTNNLHDPIKAHRRCERDLLKQLSKNCGVNMLKKKGTMLYYKSNLEMTCCSKGYECNKIDTDKYKAIAIKYLNDTETFFDDLKAIGYKTCHAIDGYDATPCSEDCDRFQKSKMKEMCDTLKGFLKCCIRRDKANCHNCRYCCTLPFCTVNHDWLLNSTITARENIGHFTEDEMKYYWQYKRHAGETFSDPYTHSKTVTAKDRLTSGGVYFKGDDNRCLKPEAGVSPEEWKHYYHEDFTTAVTKEQLKNAETRRYNKRMFNFEDPDVLNRSVSQGYRRYFRKVYGIDYVGRQNNSSSSIACAKHCLRMERTRFAKECTTNLKGQFKCCIRGINLTMFQTTMHLSKEGQNSSPWTLCDDGKCDLCIGTYFCSYTDPSTGLLTQKFVTELKSKFDENEYKEQVAPSNEFRVGACTKLDFCSKYPLSYSSAEKFNGAKSREELCDLAVYGKTTKVFRRNYRETYKECLQRDSNIRVCPKKYLEKIDVDELNEANKSINITIEKLKHSKKHKKKKRRDREKHRSIGQSRDYALQVLDDPDSAYNSSREVNMNSEENKKKPDKDSTESKSSDENKDSNEAENGREDSRDSEESEESEEDKTDSDESTTQNDTSSS